MPARPVDRHTHRALAHRAQPLRSLLLSADPRLSPGEVAGLSATQLRDALLALDPLKKDWVAAVNRAEAEFWKRWGVASAWVSGPAPPPSLPLSQPHAHTPQTSQVGRPALGLRRRDIGL
jgi:hypothetical protein